MHHIYIYIYRKGGKLHLTQRGEELISKFIIVVLGVKSTIQPRRGTLPFLRNNSHGPRTTARSILLHILMFSVVGKRCTNAPINFVMSSCFFRPLFRISDKGEERITVYLPPLPHVPAWCAITTLFYFVTFSYILFFKTFCNMNGTPWSFHSL